MGKKVNQGRDSFIFYRSFYESIDNFPREQQLELYKAVVQYALDQIPPKFTDSPYRQFLVAIWASIVPQLDANFRRFENGCKGGKYGIRGKEFGKLGGRPKKNPPKGGIDNPPNVNLNLNLNKNENECKEVGLSLPYDSQQFRETWNDLIRQPKWKGKTPTALKRCLDQLAKYPEPFAVELMNTAIANNYQGVVFASTPRDFETWSRTHQTPATPTTPIITRIDEIWEK